SAKLIFFSSRRRHTRCYRDWSSDVCSSDLYPTVDLKAAALLHSLVTGHPLIDGNKRVGWVAVRLFYRLNDQDVHPSANEAFDLRSEERRVGKESSARTEEIW